MERPKSPIRHCAIYTRKSSEEGLEQDFNSLHAQREASEAFIKNRPAKDGVWSKRLTMTAFCPAGRWNDRRCSVCCPISIKGWSM